MSSAVLCATRAGLSVLCGLVLLGSLYLIALGGTSVGTLPFVGSAAFSGAVLAWVVRDTLRTRQERSGR